MNQAETVQTSYDKKKTFSILFALLLGAFIAMFNEMSLNIALNTLMKEFQVDAPTIQWLTTAYMLVISILLPISATFLQWFTTRQLFLSSVALFTVGTFISACAPSFMILLVGRLFQAFASGLQMPLMFNTVLLIVPIEKRGSVMGLVGLIVLFAPAIAPTVSGFILNTFSWHWIFWSILPFLAIAAVVGYFNIQNVAEITRPKIDCFSIGLSSASFASLVYGFNLAGRNADGWTDLQTVTFLIIGILAFVLLIWRQLHLEQPMLDLHVFCYPAYAKGAVIVLLMMMVIFSFLILMPIYLQSGLSASAFLAGLLLLPGGILNGLTAPIAGRMFDRLGVRKMAVPGILIVIFTLGFMMQLDQQTSAWMIVVLHCLFMTGISMVMMPVQTNGLNQLPRQLYTHGTAIMSTLQQLAGAMGTAFCITIMAAKQRNYLEGLAYEPTLADHAQALILGIQDSFQYGFLFAVIALMLALRLHVVVHTRPKK